MRSRSVRTRGVGYCRHNGSRPPRLQGVRNRRRHRRGLLAHQGADVHYIARQVGHKNVSLTQDVYRHVLDRARADAMAKLDTARRAGKEDHDLSFEAGPARVAARTGSQSPGWTENCHTGWPGDQPRYRMTRTPGLPVAPPGCPRSVEPRRTRTSRRGTSLASPACRHGPTRRSGGRGLDLWA